MRSDRISGVGHHGVARDVAEARRARDLAHHRDVRPRRGVEVEEDRQPHADQEARLDALHERDEDRGRHRREVGLRVVPGALEGAEKSTSDEDGDDDGRGQGRLRQEEEQRREEQRDERDADRRERSGGGGLGAGLEVHHRARQAAGDREAAREGRADVRGAERDQLLVGVDALAALGGEGEGDRDRLHVADDRDQQRGHEELRPERHVERRQRRAGAGPWGPRRRS